VQRKWRAYLEGAPLAEQPSAAKQQPAAEQQQPAEASSWLPAGAAWDVSGAGSPTGGSPKRPYEDDGAKSDASSPTVERGKRIRGAGGQGVGLERAAWDPRRPPLASEPSLASRLTTVQLGPHLGGGGAAHLPHREATGALDGREIARALDAAVAAAMAAGELPAADYPPASVQLPSAKARRWLGSGVELNTALPMAVAAKAAQAAAPDLGRPAHLDPGSAGAAILARTELPVGVEGRVLNGHINFSSRQQGAAGAGAEPVPSGGASSPAAAQQQHAQTRKPAEKQQQQATTKPAEKQQQQQQQVTTKPAEKQQQPLGSVPHPVQRHFEVVQLRSTDASIPAAEFDLYRKYQVRCC
jgi:hypothetical protein